MIPMMNIIAWSASAPWAEIRQVEQDLIISRALIELFGTQCSRTNCAFAVGLHCTSSFSRGRCAIPKTSTLSARQQGQSARSWIAAARGLSHGSVTRRSSKASQRQNCDFGFRRKTALAISDSRWKSIRGRSRLSILHKRSVTASRIRGLREEQSFRPFHARNCSPRSCAPSCSETRGATCSIFSRRSEHSSLWTTDA